MHSTATIKCLSIRPPYAEWLANPQKFIKANIKPKTIENREWAPRYRGPLLLHSSMTFEDEALAYWLDRCPQLGKAVSLDKRDYARGAIVGIADLVDVIMESSDPWFCGTYGFVLANARPFDKSVPYRGQLNLFNVPLSAVPEVQERMNMNAKFEEIAPECAATVNVTSFRYEGSTYTVSTTDIRQLQAVQRLYDMRAGYTGMLGNYESMFFINQDDMVYPFGDLPGHAGLGVFQRYETEDEARDGHQVFVTRIQRILREVKS